MLDGRFAVTPGLSIVGDVPTVYAAIDFESPFSDQTSEERSSAFVLGNPYLGVEAALPNPRGRASAGLGGRLPVVGTLIDLGDEDGTALFYSQFASYDRFLAFIPNTLSVVGTAEGSLALSPTVSLVGRLAPQLAINAGNEQSLPDDLELFLSYTFRAEAEAGPALLTGGIRATGFLTEELGDDVARFETAIGLAAEVKAGTVRPGFFVEVPVGGNLDDLLDAVAGVGLGVDLN
ncbi:MAG: hypothetical protein AAGI52_08375 [Bacteroidota bacterium]